MYVCTWGQQCTPALPAADAAWTAQESPHNTVIPLRPVVTPISLGQMDSKLELGEAEDRELEEGAGRAEPGFWGRSRQESALLRRFFKFENIPIAR